MDINKKTRYPCRYDRRPCDIEGIVDSRIAGYFIHKAKAISLKNCAVVWGENRPDYYGHALEAGEVDNLRIDNFNGKAAHPERDEAIKIHPENKVIS